MLHNKIFTCKFLWLLLVIQNIIHLLHKGMFTCKLLLKLIDFFWWLHSIGIEFWNFWLIYYPFIPQSYGEENVDRKYYVEELAINIPCIPERRRVYQHIYQILFTLIHLIINIFAIIVKDTCQSLHQIFNTSLIKRSILWGKVFRKGVFDGIHITNPIGKEVVERPKQMIGRNYYLVFIFNLN